MNEELLQADGELIKGLCIVGGALEYIETCSPDNKKKLLELLYVCSYAYAQEVKPEPKGVE